MLQRIHHQIIQNDITLTDVKWYHCDTFVSIQDHPNPTLFSLGYEVTDTLLNPRIKGVGLKLQFDCLSSHLFQIEHHIDDICHSARLSASRLQQAIVFIIRTDSLQHTFQWRIDQRQRCTQFVADIDQKINLFLVHPELILRNCPFHRLLFANHDVADKPSSDDQEDSYDTAQEPPTLIPRRQYIKTSQRLVFRPAAIIQQRGYLHIVMPRMQVEQTQSTIDIFHRFCTVVMHFKPIITFAETVPILCQQR